jgi:transposase-like protein
MLSSAGADASSIVIKGDVTCPGCGAGFRRIELSFRQGTKGEYRCPVCDQIIEVLDGSKLVAYRLTVQPSSLCQE